MESHISKCQGKPLNLLIIYLSLFVQDLKVKHSAKRQRKNWQVHRTWKDACVPSRTMWQELRGSVDMWSSNPISFETQGNRNIFTHLCNFLFHGWLWKKKLQVGTTSKPLSYTTMRRDNVSRLTGAKFPRRITIRAWCECVPEDYDTLLIMIPDPFLESPDRTPKLMVAILRTPICHFVHF